MGIRLARGKDVSLTAVAPDVTVFAVAFGWEVSEPEIELDASALACGEDDKILSDSHFIFFDNLRSPDGSVRHTGDETNFGRRDDEIIEVILAAIPPDVVSVVFVASIYETKYHSATFEQVQNAYIRLLDRSNGAELVRYDVSDEASTGNAMVFGELYRCDGDWNFRATGRGYISGLAGVAHDYGVNV